MGGKGAVALLRDGQAWVLRHSAQMAGKFGKGVGDSAPRIDVGAEFVVAAVKVLNEGVACTDHLC